MVTSAKLIMIQWVRNSYGMWTQAAQNMNNNTNAKRKTGRRALQGNSPLPQTKNDHDQAQPTSSYGDEGEISQTDIDLAFKRVLILMQICHFATKCLRLLTIVAFCLFSFFFIRALCLLEWSGGKEAANGLVDCLKELNQECYLHTRTLIFPSSVDSNSYYMVCKLAESSDRFSTPLYEVSVQIALRNPVIMLLALLSMLLNLYSLSLIRNFLQSITKTLNSGLLGEIPSAGSGHPVIRY